MKQQSKNQRVSNRALAAGFLALACVAQQSVIADTLAERSDLVLDYLNSDSPNTGQTGGGPHRIGRTGAWYGAARLLRGDTTNGLNYISAAVGDADAENSNAGFSLWPCMDTWYRWKHVFPQTLKDKYRTEYTTATLYRAGSTPNQVLMAATGCYLACQEWGVDAVTQFSAANYNGSSDRTGKTTIENEIARIPWSNSSEHNANHYLIYSIGPVRTIADWSADPVLKNKASMAYDWLLADAAPGWLDGHWCISSTRGSTTGTRTGYDLTDLGLWLKFGGATPSSLAESSNIAQYTMPEYPGLPPEILAAATDRTSPFVRRSFAERGVSGTKVAYLKQTYMTPGYALWSQIEADISFNADGSFKIIDYDTAYIQDGYQGQRWGLAWIDAPAAESVISIGSPTTYSGSTGGISIYEDTMQHEDTLLAVYNIPAPSGQSGNDGSYPNQYVKGNIPNGYLAYTDESDATGRIFLHYNNLMVSIYLTDAFANYTGSPGFQYNCSKLGVVVETAPPTDYPQATAAERLAAFRADILSHSVTDKSAINDAAPRLTYTNRKGKTLSLTYGQAGSINGSPVDYQQWPMLENPWMKQYPKGDLHLFGPDRTLVYDFHNWQVKTNHRPTVVAAANPVFSGTQSVDVNLEPRVSDAETAASRMNFRVTGANGGTAVLQPDGHNVRFTPAAAANPGSFTFAASDEGVDSRLVFHYDFEQGNPVANDSVVDQSGNERPATVATIGTGTALGDSSVPPALARADSQSLRLHSSSVASAKLSRQIHTCNASLANGGWTYSTWFKRADYEDDDFLFYLGTGDGYGGNGDELQVYCPAQSQSIRLLHFNASNAQDVSLTGTGVAAGEWRHVAIRFDRTANNTGNLTLFLDGKACGTANGITWQPPQSTPVFIGGPALSSVVTRDFDGWIDDVALFREALPDGDVAALAGGTVASFGGLAVSQSVNVDTSLVAPSGATATATAANNSISVNWSSVPGSISYNVKRATSAGGPYTVIASGLSGTSYTDIGAAFGTTFYYVITASNAFGESPASIAISAGLPTTDPSIWNSGLMSAWSKGARIAVTGYSGSETLADFPILVAIDSTSVPGFSYAQMAFSNGADLRFTDATGTTILSHEIDKWNTSGTSYVWVKVPSLSAATGIIAFWGNPLSAQTAQPDSIANLSMWLKADAITGLADGATVTSWSDASTSGVNDATLLQGTPQYKTSVLNGKPVVRFTTNGESAFSFPQQTNIRTVFMVVKETSAVGLHFLLGDDDKYHFHRGGSGTLWSSTNASANILGGTTKLNGTAVNGTTAALGTGFKIVSVVTTGDVEASRICKDRSIAGRSWDGDVAEIIVYSRSLTASEEARVGAYLDQKYGLATAYASSLPAYATDGSTWSNGYSAVYHMNETSGQHLSSTAGAAPTREMTATIQGSAAGIVAGSDSFNGTTGYFGLPNLGSPAAVTVEAWINPAAAPGASGAGIVSSDLWTTGCTHFRLQSNLSANAAGYLGGTASSAANAIALNTWNHVAYSSSAGDGNLRLYANGALVASSLGLASNNLTDSNVARENSSRYLNGKVDEVRISSVVRSAAWIQATKASISSPASFLRGAPAATYATAYAPMLASLAPTAISATGATIRGSLVSTGGSATTVTFYWGATDGGTNPASWTNNVPLGAKSVGSVSANLTGLSQGATYYYRVAATNATGTTWSADVQRFPTLPAAPSGLVASSADGVVNLSWNAAPGATGYNVQRSSSVGGPYTPLLQNTPGTSASDPGVAAGELAYYIVAAVNGSGAGANSAPVSIQLLAAPSGLAATAGSGSVALAWTAVPGAATYSVKRSASASGPFTSIQTAIVGTSHTDASAPNGSTWYYTVHAVAGTSESAASDVAEATPNASIPAPTGLAAVPANNGAYLSWSSVSAALTYSVKRATVSGGPYTTIATGLLSPVFTDSGLTNGTTYYYTVSAQNGTVASANSAQVTLVPAPTPTIFTTASAGAWSLASWSPVAPLAGFDSQVILNNASSMASSQDLGSFLLNKLQFGGQAVALTGSALYFAGTNASLVTTGNYAHSVANGLILADGTTFNVAANTLTVNGVISGDHGLVKSGAGTLALGSTNTYSGDTTLDGGTLRYLAANAGVKNLVFGSALGSTAISSLDLSTQSISTTGLTVRNNNTGNNTITIGAGKSLAVHGGVSFDTAVSGTAKLVVSGAGSMSVSTGSDDFLIGATSDANTRSFTLDLSGLAGGFSANVDNFLVGQTRATYNNVPNATVKLAPGSVISAETIAIGDDITGNGGNNGGQSTTVTLAGGANQLNATTLTVGRIKSGTHTLNFASGGGTVELSGTAGGSMDTIYIGYKSHTGSTGNVTGVVDFTNGTVTGAVEEVNVGRMLSSQGSGSPKAIGTLVFGPSAGNNVAITTLRIGTFSGTTVPTSTKYADGTVTIQGGQVAVGSLEMTSELYSFARLNLNGGTLTLAGPIAASASPNTSITLNGGTLDMAGNSIGDATNDVAALNFQAGTLANAGPINGTGGVRKTGAGTLVLAGTNTYTGPTDVTAGTLAMGNAYALPAGSAVTVSAGATLNFASYDQNIASINAASGSTVNLAGASLAVVGNSVLSGSVTGSGTLLLAGTTRLDAGASFAPTVQLVNNGTLDLSNWSGALPANLVNNGSIYRASIALVATDAYGTSSFGSQAVAGMTVSNWADGLFPAPGTNYSSGAFSLRTPAAAGNYTFPGYTLTLETNGLLVHKSGTNSVITVPDLKLNGGRLNTGNASTAWTLAGNIEVLAPSYVDFSQASSSLAIAAPISGTGSLATNGSDTTFKLALSAANTFSGGFTLKTGTLLINNAAALGTGTFAINNSAGSPVIDNTSGAAIVIGTANAQVWDSGFAFTGTSDLDLGVGPVSLGTASGTARAVNVQAGKLTVGGAITDGTTATGLTKDGAGTMVLAGQNGFSGALAINAGVLQLGNGVSSNGGLACSTVLNNASMVVASFTSQQLAMPITGTGSLVKSGGNSTVLTLAGNNTFSGAVSITNGTVVATSSSSLGAGVKTISIANGSAGNSMLNLDGTAGGVNLPAGFTYSTSNANGTIYNLAGDNSISGQINMTSGGGNTVVRVQAGTLDIKANVTATVTGRTLVLGGAGNGKVSGNIVHTGSNAFGLTKSEAGTWVLSGANTYTGPTTINAGTLQVDGSLGGSGAVSVGATATLAGTGTIQGPVTVIGAFAPATLDVNNTLTLASTSVTNLVLDRSATPNSTQATGMTSVVYGGTLTVVNSGGALQAGDLFVLFDAGSYSGSFATLNLPVLTTGLAWDTSALAVDGTITVKDVLPPAITVPLNLTLEATGPSGSLASFTTSAIDLVDGAVASIATPASGSVFPLGTTTVTVTASDVAGNSANRTFTVTVQDTTDPVITVPTNITLEASGATGAVASFTTSATDVVSGAVTASTSPASGSVFPLGTTTVTVTASDVAGNDASRTFTVTVQDTTPPAITVPSNMTVEASGSSGAVVSFTTSATDTVSGARPTVATPASGSTFPVGTTTVTVTASDIAGNDANRTFTVTVVDTTAPVITVPSNMTVEATGPTGATVSFGTSASDLVSGAVAANNLPASGSVFPIGTTTVTTTASDAAGNTANDSFTVTVVDTTAPVITVPSNMTVEATGPAGATVSFSTSASDLVSGSVATSNNPVSGSVFPLGTTTVTTTASDAAGNVANDSFTVTVVDTTAPVITVPPNMTVEATGPTGATVNFSTSASDLVSGSVATSNNPVSGSVFPLGATTVTTTASDAAGNVANDSFTVTVVDTTAPVITVPSNMTVEATGPTGATVNFSTSASDLVSGSVATSNNPVSGSVFPLGTTTVTTTASDAAGNVANDSFTVTVVDTTAPVITVPSNMTVEATGPAGATVNFGTSASDLVSGSVATSNNPVSGSVFPLGATTVTTTASDAAGNVANHSFTVTVVDTTAPVITVPSNMTVEATGPTGATVSFSTSASDLVSGSVATSNSPVSGSVFPLGATTVTTTASDAAGNVANHSFTVTVVDTTAPVITVPSNMTVEATGPTGATVNFSTSASDLVSGSVATSNNPVSGSVFPLGATTVTTTASDAAGNVANDSFTVTVVDTTAPVITVPSNMTVEATGPTGATVNFSTSANDLVSGTVATNNSPASGSVFPLGTTTVTTTASDAAGNTANATFTVTVNPWNSAPLLAAVGNQTIGQGQTLAFTASATDTDTPAQTLTYSLDAGAPAGATIHATTGAFSWTTSTSQAIGDYPVTIRVTDNGSPARDDFETITITVTSSLPAPRQTSDIGSVGLAGSAIHNAGTYTLQGAGTGISGSADACRFVYQQASGDCDVTVRVQSLTNTGTSAKAGVMIRDSLNANALEAGVWVTPANGIQFTRRTSTGGTTAVSSSTGKAAPYWVRLTRTGNVFKAFYSTNGTSWTQFGSNRTISMAASTYIGIATTSGTTATLCTGVITNETVTP